MTRGSVRGARHRRFEVALAVLFGLTVPVDALADEAGPPPAARWVSADAVIYAEMSRPAALIATVIRPVSTS